MHSAIGTNIIGSAATATRRMVPAGSHVAKPGGQRSDLNIEVLLFRQLELLVGDVGVEGELFVRLGMGDGEIEVGFRERDVTLQWLKDLRVVPEGDLSCVLVPNSEHILDPWLVLLSSRLEARCHEDLLQIFLQELLNIRLRVLGKSWIARDVMLGSKIANSGKDRSKAGGKALGALAAFRDSECVGHGVVIQPAASALAGLILAVLALREPTTARRMLGAGAIVVGLSLFGAEATTTIGRHGLLGDFLFLVAGIAWGVFGILLRHWRIDGTRAAIVICVLALVLYAPAHGLIWGYDRLIAAGLTENLVQVVAQGLLAGVAAIYLFARAVSLLGASRASTFPALVPAFGIVIGWLTLGEVPTVYQLAGLAVVALGFRLALKQ